MRKVFILAIGVLVLSACGTDEEDNTAASENMTFKGYECTQDCSGHEAGYAWAEENGITDPDQCGGTSNSFYEGCLAYTEEN